MELGAQRILGWSEEEMIGQTLERLFREEDLAAGLLKVEKVSFQNELTSRIKLAEARIGSKSNALSVRSLSSAVGCREYGIDIK
jgi:PAS domain-containing protein